ncbi:MAG: DUF6145 family protein [Clostridia bacterium]|nr:DUF6145 family protein [Clostridia bacterium]MCI1999054.1 DUF6145 family protein [Clostridia bacterium]MCI2013804.1 DUF6145 family protein [Clostridia bacterium]
MDKKIMAAASFEKQKFFIDPEFAAIPDEVKKEVQTICVYLAEKLMCTFIMGFHENGDVYFETIKGEDISDFDDIGAELEIKALRKDKAKLLEALKIWYVIYKTPGGEKVKTELIEKYKKEK